MTGIAPTIGGRASPGGFTGATAAVRFAGGTTTGAPTTGTFAVGDFVVSNDGNVFVCVTAGTPGTWTCSSKSRTQLQANATGVITEPFSPGSTTGVAPSTQVVFGTLFGLRAGDLVTGILLRNAVAAAGSLPTTARAGLTDSTGKILALSGNLNALANWALGANPFPFTAPYTATVDGGYFGCFIVNGVWGTTQPTTSEGSSNAGNLAFSTNAPPSFQWSAQTDLPAVGQSVTLTATGRSYYIAPY